jgi:hypothetical protein
LSGSLMSKKRRRLTRLRQPAWAEHPVLEH